MTKEEIMVVVEQLKVDFEDLKIKLGGIGSFNPEAVAETYTIIQEVVKTIEGYSITIKTLSGEDKKAVALELINDIVDVPFVPEFVESALIGWSIDLAVDLFNKLGGKTWLDTLFGSTEEPPVE